MFFLFEGFQAQNVLILFYFLIFFVRSYLLIVKITPDVNNFLKLGILGM